MVWTLDLYRRLVSVRIRSQMQYRASFWMDMLSTLIGTGIYFLTLALVFEKFGNIAAWSLGEVAFLYGTVEVGFGLMDMLFSGFDPRNFGMQVRRGFFDQLLLRPVPITWQVLGSEFMLRRLGRVIQGAAVLILSFNMTRLQWTLIKIVYLPVVLASLVAFFGGLFIIGATITFWTVESIEAINIFTYGGTEMLAYPMSIYPNWLVRFFTFILPAVFLNYYPALYFLDKPDPFHLPAFAPFMAPFAGFSLLAAGLLFWNFGIRHYQSTGT